MTFQTCLICSPSCVQKPLRVGGQPYGRHRLFISCVLFSTSTERGKPKPCWLPWWSLVNLDPVPVMKLGLDNPSYQLWGSAQDPHTSSSAGPRWSTLRPHLCAFNHISKSKTVSVKSTAENIYTNLSLLRDSTCTLYFKVFFPSHHLFFLFICGPF